MRWVDKYKPEILRLARPYHWAEARQWLVYMFVGGCLPFWGTAFLLSLFAVRWRFEDVLGRGELAVFSAGLLASAIPVLRRRIRRSPVEQPEALFTTAVVLLFPAALMFAAATLAERFPDVLRMNWGAMLAISGALFIISIAIAFFTELINNVRNDPDIVVLDSGAQDKLRAKVINALEGR